MVHLNLGFCTNSVNCIYLCSMRFLKRNVCATTCTLCEHFLFFAIKKCKVRNNLLAHCLQVTHGFFICSTVALTVSTHSGVSVSLASHPTTAAPISTSVLATTAKMGPLVLILYVFCFFFPLSLY